MSNKLSYKSKKKKKIGFQTYPKITNTYKKKILFPQLQKAINTFYWDNKWWLELIVKIIFTPNY